MTTEQKEKILKKVKKAAGIPETVTVYDERIDDLIPDAVVEMITGGVPLSIIDEASPAVITTIAHYVCYELAGDIGETKNANWHHSEFENLEFLLSLEKDGATMEGML